MPMAQPIATTSLLSLEVPILSFGARYDKHGLYFKELYDHGFSFYTLKILIDMLTWVANMSDHEHMQREVELKIYCLSP